MNRVVLTVILLMFTIAAPANAFTVGWASFYHSGQITANGEPFKPMGLTAASRKLPFGTFLKVTNLRSGISVIVRVNDRGPYVDGRILDLSLGAAKKIGIINEGVARISYTILNQ
jgi:rare lipoprotein A